MAHALRAGAGRLELAASASEVTAAQALAGSWKSGGAEPRSVAVPTELHDLIGQVLASVARGETVTVGTMPEELSTSVAAEQLGISRPTLMKLIADGDLPAHKVGTHTRVRTEDVVAFRRARVERQRAAFEELRALEDELDI